MMKFKIFSYNYIEKIWKNYIQLIFIYNKNSNLLKVKKNKIKINNNNIKFLKKNLNKYLIYFKLSIDKLIWKIEKKF